MIVLNSAKYYTMYYELSKKWHTICIIYTLRFYENSIDQNQCILDSIFQLYSQLPRYYFIMITTSFSSIWEPLSFSISSLSSAINFV